MYKAYRSTIERKNQLRWQRIVRLDGLPVEQIYMRKQARARKLARELTEVQVTPPTKEEKALTN